MVTCVCSSSAGEAQTGRVLLGWEGIEGLETTSQHDIFVDEDAFRGLN